MAMLGEYDGEMEEIDVAEEYDEDLHDVCRGDLEEELKDLKELNEIDECYGKDHHSVNGTEPKYVEKVFSEEDPGHVESTDLVELKGVTHDWQVDEILVELTEDNPGEHTGKVQDEQVVIQGQLQDVEVGQEEDEGETQNVQLRDIQDGQLQDDVKDGQEEDEDETQNVQAGDIQDGQLEDVEDGQEEDEGETQNVQSGDIQDEQLQDVEDGQEEDEGETQNVLSGDIQDEQTGKPGDWQSQNIQDEGSSPMHSIESTDIIADYVQDEALVETGNVGIEDEMLDDQQTKVVEVTSEIETVTEQDYGESKCLERDEDVVDETGEDDETAESVVMRKDDDGGMRREEEEEKDGVVLMSGLLRHHSGSPQSVQRDVSPGQYLSVTDGASQQGKFTLQTRRSADPLHFIHSIHNKNLEGIDPETDDLIHIIRSTHTTVHEDRDVRSSRGHSLVTAPLILQFEKPPDEEGASQSDAAMATHEPLSDKERMSSREEEKSKERASTSSSLDDLDCVSQSTCPLNLMPNKDRAQLRNKGSLAQRRKPTRPCLPLPGQEESLFPTTEDESPTVVTNGHVSLEISTNGYEGEGSDALDSAHSTTDSSHSEPASSPTSDNMPGSSLITRSPVPGVSKGIILPGLAPGFKPKLRSKPVRPHPSDSPSSETPPPAQPDTPPWFANAKLRKTRPPKGEAEKLKQETQPETPAWMKDAESKRRRASGIMLAKKQNSYSTEETPTPWQQERSRSIPAIPSSDLPLSLHKTQPSQSAHVSEGVTSEAPTTPGNTPPATVEVRTPPVVPTKPPLTSKQPPVTGQAPNSPPATVPSWKSEIASRRKSKTGVTPATEVSDDVPPWKRELAERRRTRLGSEEITPPSPTQVSQSTVPPWMQELEQRKKKSLTSGSGKMFNPLAEPQVTASHGTSEELPEWARVAAQRRAKRKNSTGFSHLSLSDEDA